MEKKFVRNVKLNIGLKKLAKVGLIFLISFSLFFCAGAYAVKGIDSEAKAVNNSIYDNDTESFEEYLAEEAETLTAAPDKLIRFHVIANSDSEFDQALKRAVRDAILKEVSPRLANSQSLVESRQILQDLGPQMEQIAQAAVKEWGQSYKVKLAYGKFNFPTKSYGSLVLPAGEYEAVRILIGDAQGSNWWCVLFPPLCFVDIENSTAVPVDGKPGIPLKKDSLQQPQEKAPAKNVEVKFWFWEKLKEITK